MATSALVYAGLLSPRYILFVAPWVYKKFPPEIWRLATSFWLTGPQLGMVFDPFLLWTYGSNLERDSPRFSRKGDFFVYVVFVHLLILVGVLHAYFLCLLHLIPYAAIVYIEPLISARAAFPSCSGSWRRGRSPLHCAQVHHSQSIQRTCVECGHGGKCHLRKLS